MLLCVCLRDESVFSFAVSLSSFRLPPSAVYLYIACSIVFWFSVASGFFVATGAVVAALYSGVPSLFPCLYQTSLVAVVVADPDQTLQWVRETRGAAAAEAHTFAEWLEDPEVQRVIQEDMQQVAKKQGLKGFELARKVYFRAEQFTVENGLLTPTFKLKRHYAQEVSCAVTNTHGDVVENLEWQSTHIRL